MKGFIDNVTLYLVFESYPEGEMKISLVLVKEKAWEKNEDMKVHVFFKEQFLHFCPKRLGKWWGHLPMMEKKKNEHLIRKSWKMKEYVEDRGKEFFWTC